MEPIEIRRCQSCHGRTLASRERCPRCGSAELASETVPPSGIVLAATELTSPPEGWASPHRIALVEAVEDVRLLALVDGELPELGSTVVIRRVDGLWRVRPRA